MKKLLREIVKPLVEKHIQVNIKSKGTIKSTRFATDIINSGRDYTGIKEA